MVWYIFTAKSRALRFMFQQRENVSIKSSRKNFGPHYISYKLFYGKNLYLSDPYLLCVCNSVNELLFML